MERYGVVDIGSNTVRLEIYSLDGKEINLFFKKKETLGLSSYVKKKKISNKGIKKTVEVLDDYIRTCEIIGVEGLFIFATAAIRNAKNSKEVVEEIEAQTGHRIDLISGEREAELGFRAISHEFGIDSGMTVDIGGGSTEISLYDKGQYVYSTSFTDGALSLYTAYVDQIFPNPYEYLRLKKKIDSHVKTTKKIQNRQYKTIAGVGGTIRFISILLDEYKDREPSLRIDVATMKKVYKLLLDRNMTIIKMVLQIRPERIHLVIPGMMMLLAICDSFGVEEILVSEAGVRQGYLLEKIGER